MIGRIILVLDKYYNLFNMGIILIIFINVSL